MYSINEENQTHAINKIFLFLTNIIKYRLIIKITNIIRNHFKLCEQTVHDDDASFVLSHGAIIIFSYKFILI